MILKIVAALLRQNSSPELTVAGIQRPYASRVRQKDSVLYSFHLRMKGDMASKKDNLGYTMHLPTHPQLLTGMELKAEASCG